MYSICSFHEVDIREVVDKHELTYGNYFSGSVHLLLRNLPYSVQSGREDVNPQYDFVTFESKANVFALYKPVIRLRAHGHLF